jgi:hypothetical protein
MSNVSSTELFSVNYLITVTLAGGTDATVNSDAELQSNINASLTTQATITQAEENSKKLETILVDGVSVQSFITAGVDSANNYKDSTVDFANDMKAVTTLTTAAGTYAVSSELDVFKIELHRK